MEVFWILAIFFGSFDLIFGEMSNSLTQRDYGMIPQEIVLGGSLRYVLWVQIFDWIHFSLVVVLWHLPLLYWALSWSTRAARPGSLCHCGRCSYCLFLLHIQSYHRFTLVEHSALMATISSIHDASTWSLCHVTSLQLLYLRDGVQMSPRQDGVKLCIHL